MSKRLNPNAEREVGPYSRPGMSVHGVRGLAVLGVMASHLFPGDVKTLLERAVGATLSFGATGVDLFFVLSGFLITGILYDSLSDSGYFRKFYARRTLRIFPLYYGVLLAILLFYPWLHITYHRQLWAYVFYLQNTDAVISANVWQSARVSLSHFWSLAVEEQFYLVWPLAVFFLRDIKKLLWACLAFSTIALVLRFYLAFHHAAYHIINCNTLCRADSLLMGAALALLLRTHLHDSILRFARVTFVAAATTLIGLNLLRLGLLHDAAALIAFDASYLALRYTILAVASAALIAWCLRPTAATRHFFERPLLRFFGKYSYGLYVLHLIIFGFVSPPFRSLANSYFPSKIWGVVLEGILVFFVSIAAAYASYHLYEKQFLRMKRFFDYNRTQLKDRDTSPQPPTTVASSV